MLFTVFLLADFKENQTILVIKIHAKIPETRKLESIHE
jgi:hypothetical protein